MKLELFATIVGVLGAAVCVLGFVLHFVVRVKPEQITIAPINVFISGIGLMVFACFLKLHTRE